MILLSSQSTNLILRQDSEPCPTAMYVLFVQVSVLAVSSNCMLRRQIERHAEVTKLISVIAITAIDRVDHRVANVYNYCKTWSKSKIINVFYLEIIVLANRAFSSGKDNAMTSKSTEHPTFDLSSSKVRRRILEQLLIFRL